MNKLAMIQNPHIQLLKHVAIIWFGPGDILIIEVVLIQSKQDVHKFSANCKVNDEIVCTAELLGAVKGK